MFFGKGKCHVTLLRNAAPQRSAVKMEEGFASTPELQVFASPMAVIFNTGTHFVTWTNFLILPSVFFLWWVLIMGEYMYQPIKPFGEFQDMYGYSTVCATP
jgi:hypothetical protein